MTVPAETTFQIVVGLIGSLAGALLALAYQRRVRLERPPIGTFNGRDLGVLGVFIVLLPAGYLLVAPPVLTGFLVVTFLSALLIALRPLVSSRTLWVAVPVALIANIAVTAHMDTLPAGLPLYWLLTSAIVMLAAVGVANLYVQGGLHLRHIAWFTLFLAVNDLAFTRFVPLTPQLAVALQGRPLDPSIGFATHAYNANVGLGDLLVFCLYTTAAAREFGRRGALTALGLIAAFGAIAPAVTPLLVPGVFGTTAAAFVPVQTLFGPAALAGYFVLARRRPAPARLAGAPAAPRPARSTAGLGLRGTAAAGLAAAVIFGAGATVPAGAAPAAPADTGPGPRVELHQVAFTPGRVVARVGQTIHWRNRDRVPHDIVATSGSGFDSGIVPPGGTFTFLATRPGTVDYVCTLHQGMRGTITVRAR
jgi:plastocyanin